MSEQEKPQETASAPAHKLAKEIVLGAITELRERGWAQGTYGTPEGPKCLSGALRHVANGHPLHFPAEGDATREYVKAYDVVNAVVLERSGDAYTMVPWNDASTTTEADVVDVLEEAARRLE